MARTSYYYFCCYYRCYCYCYDDDDYYYYYYYDDCVPQWQPMAGWGVLPGHASWLPAELHIGNGCWPRAEPRWP